MKSVGGLGWESIGFDCGGGTPEARGWLRVIVVNLFVYL